MVLLKVLVVFFVGLAWINFGVDRLSDFTRAVEFANPYADLDRAVLASLAFIYAVPIMFGLLVANIHP